MKFPPGYTVWCGTSRLDHKTPLIAVLTLKSENRKTGDVPQLWIVARDRSPLDQLRQENRGVCGDCPLQGRYDAEANHIFGRVCYVNLGHAPAQVWRSWHAGRYPAIGAAALRTLLRGRTIRIGAYGEPAALPLRVVRLLAESAQFHTAYSHSLFDIPRNRADKLARYCMVSSDSPAQLAAAAQRGWRGFLCVRHAKQAPQSALECPFQARGVQCGQCRLCDGAGGRSSRNIWVLAHGSGKTNLPS